MSPTAMPAGGERRAAPALLITALTLGLLVQLMLPTGASPPLSRTAHVGAVSELAPPAPVPAYGAIVLHPLFNSARSPAGSGGASEVASVGAFGLMAVASDGRRASAVLKAAAGTIRTLDLGQSLDGWRLAGVSGDTAVLERAGQRQTLHVGDPPKVAGGVLGLPQANLR